MSGQLTLIDLIDIFQLYKQTSRTAMIKNLVVKCKHYAVEDVENLYMNETL